MRSSDSFGRRGASTDPGSRNPIKRQSLQTLRLCRVLVDVDTGATLAAFSRFMAIARHINTLNCLCTFFPGEQEQTNEFDALSQAEPRGFLLWVKSQGRA